VGITGRIPADSAFITIGKIKAPAAQVNLFFYIEYASGQLQGIGLGLVHDEQCQPGSGFFTDPGEGGQTLNQIEHGLGTVHGRTS
jgi:hypothetical protein